MTKSITIRLDDTLVHKLEHVAEHTNRTKSDVIRDCLRRQLSVKLLDLAREKLVPLAQKQGIFTDEDVFELLKRNPKTGTINGLESSSPQEKVRCAIECDAGKANEAHDASDGTKNENPIAKN